LLARKLADGWWLLEMRVIFIQVKSGGGKRVSPVTRCIYQVT